MKFTNIILVIFLAVLLLPNADAAQKKSYAMSKKVFQEIEKVNLLLDKDDFSGANKELTELLSKRLSTYEKAQVNYMLGSIAYQQGNTPKAIEKFKRVLKAEGDMPELLYLRTLKTLAQLSLIEESLNEAKTYSLKLIDLHKAKPLAEDYALLAQVHYRLGDYPATIKSVNQSIAITRQNNKKPKENVLLLLNSAYFEMKNFELMIPVLEHIIKLYPKPMYMLYLSSIYGQLDHIDKQTVIMESLYENGDLKKGNQLINLANLYLSEKVPFKAATVLERAMQEDVIETNIHNLEMLSQAWMLAGNSQKSIVALSKAAEQSADGQLYFKQAYLHYNLAEWALAEQSVFLALDKGLANDKDIGEAWLLIGMVRFYQQHFDKAIIACQKASEISASKELALSWIKYIQSEQSKYEYMLEITKEAL